MIHRICNSLEGRESIIKIDGERESRQTIKREPKRKK
jgi:hypothetical protein